MNHALAELTAQEADLLPARLTLCPFMRPMDTFLTQPVTETSTETSAETSTSTVDATNLAMGNGAAATQTIDVQQLPMR
ncbi:hypothetical protein [Amycolatopsis taiwanensis]|uniref:Uncharacterized protein n=1 Tax=Amycolatopsis taiwanensis TaxID=342230 RepID=A0A9W6QY90_9PSEU|nr:hypothetical protein [Amycolatopsis taiwanensis]GLY65928.1 hypothetical protein Atai01_25470 [Amycolatopsis taiwanensis]